MRLWLLYNCVYYTLSVEFVVRVWAFTTEAIGSPPTTHWRVSMNKVAQSGDLSPHLLFALGILVGVSAVVAWLILR